MRLALFLCGMVQAFAGEPDNWRLLERARIQMAQNLSRLPNYTCLQTIERSARPAPAKRFEFLDTVRLEVALVEGNELFAWPGAGKFEEKEIGDMVSGGAIGNGIFALHAKAVFQSGVPAFEYAGELPWKGRRAHKWTFAVPQSRSGYTLRVGEREAIVGYEGSFLADAVTFEILRLEVNATDIPEHLQMKSATSSVEYQRVRISGETFSLPASSELYMTDMRGGVSHNRTVFSSCRQYTGESVLMFDDPANVGPDSRPAVRDVEIPPNISLDIELLTPIDGSLAAVGDPITAILKKRLKLADGEIPKGAFVHGRITLFRRVQGPRMPAYAVGLSFFEIESQEIRARCNAKLEDLYHATPSISTNPFGSRRAIANVDYSSLLREGSVVFVQGYNLKIDRGLRMVWRTQPVKTE
jgi:hypothetical protein